MIARRVVDSGSLRFVEPLPGRLLWVHFLHKSHPVDLLNFYQHTWKGSERVAQLRHRALDILTKTVQSVSLRSVLVIAGDCNAQCTSRLPHVGPTVMSHTHWAEDSDEFQSFIEGNDLVALNTFTSLPKPNACYTYLWGSQRSQLDYVFLRRTHATGPSKQVFPAKRPPESVRPYQDIQLQGYAVRMWSHFHAFRKLRSLGSTPLSTILRAWHHKSAYLRMRAAAKKRSAELRKLKRDRLFATAKEAAAGGNLREFYKVVRLLAPQGCKRRFQLCQGGMPLPPERELSIMTRHFEQQYASHDDHLTESVSWACHASVEITADEVQWHLDRLPARKAGAPSTSPGAVWRLCSDLVSPFVAQQLSDRWGSGGKSVPHLWTKAMVIAFC